MKNEKIEQAISKHLESKVLVLMSYPAEYIEDVKTDMACAFRKGAEWMAGQGETHEAEIIESVPFGGTKWKRCVKVWLDDQFQAKGNKVVVQIRKK